jgi:hypothetical protein
MSASDHALLVISWIVLNLVLALVPLFVSILFKFFFSLSVTWIQILKEGELFLFSTTVSANAISKLVLPTPSETSSLGKIALVFPQLSPDKAFTLIGLILILLLSTIIFGAMSLIKFNNLKKIKVGNRNYTFGAFGCAATSSILSYIAFVQGGMK